MSGDATAVEESTRRPSPRIAALLNVIVPGLGRLYIGQPWPALLTWLAVPVAIALTMMLSFAIPGRFVHLLLLLLLVPGLWVALAWDAHRATRVRVPLPRKWWQRPLTLTAIALTTGLIAQPMLPHAIRATVAGAYRSPTISMQPAIMAGDWFFTSKHRGGAPERGDIVIFDAEGGPRIFRVVGLAGDTLSMADYRLILDGEVPNEPYARLHRFGPASHAENGAVIGAPAHEHTWGPLVVPRDSVFVLGDTRNAAADSRYNGFVAIDRIVARPEWVYFSRDPETGAIRWSRLGIAIE